MPGISTCRVAKSPNVFKVVRIVQDEYLCMMPIVQVPISVFNLRRRKECASNLAIYSLILTEQKAQNDKFLNRKKKTRRRGAFIHLFGNDQSTKHETGIGNFLGPVASFGNNRCGTPNFRLSLLQEYRQSFSFFHG